MNKEDMPMVKMYMIGFRSKEKQGEIQTIHFDSAEVLLDFKHRLEEFVGDDLVITYVGEVNVVHTISDKVIKAVEDYFS